MAWLLCLELCSELCAHIAVRKGGNATVMHTARCNGSTLVVARYAALYPFACRMLVRSLLHSTRIRCKSRIAIMQPFERLDQCANLEVDADRRQHVRRQLVRRVRKPQQERTLADALQQ